MAQVSQISVLDADSARRDVATLTAIAALIGEVQASPTSNTLLDRLKALNTSIGAGNTLLQGVIDAVEAIPGGSGGGGDASAANQATIIAALSTIAGYVDGIEGALSTLNGKDFATQTTLAALLAKVIAAPSTEAKQDTGNTSLATIAAKDFATQTTLAAVLAKLIAAPATEAKQDSIIGYVDGIETLLTALNALITTQNGYLDGLETLIGASNTKLDTLHADVGAATPAGENHIGAVGGNTSYIDVTLSLDTSAYASGDLMADTQVVTNAMRVNDGTGVLQSVQVLDEDDQGVAFDLVFLSANNTLGTENSAVSVSDANARDILGLLSIASGDFIDLGGCRIATKMGVGLVVRSATGTRNLYVAAIARGAPTYTASGVRLRLGFLQD